MVTDRLGNRNFMQPIRRLQGAKFALLSFFGAGGRGAFCSLKFQRCSHQVPRNASFVGGQI
jgi:hypothetical protein